MKNDIHETSTDRAQSIANNIVMNRSAVRDHPFFNRKLDELPMIDYKPLDLYELTQITEQQQIDLENLL